MIRPDHRSTPPDVRRATSARGGLALFGALVAGAPRKSAAEGTLLVALGANALVRRGARM
jgi:hypothetical protein